MVVYVTVLDIRRFKQTTSLAKLKPLQDYIRIAREDLPLKCAKLSTRQARLVCCHHFTEAFFYISFKWNDVIDTTQLCAKREPEV